jgi:hypothetical protein
LPSCSPASVVGFDVFSQKGELQRRKKMKTETERENGKNI